MTSEQAFEILGIYDKNIDETDLKRAFREAARNTHPDANPDDKYAKNRFYMINEAYQVLCEYLRYENDRRQKAKTEKEYKDKWDYYTEADRKFSEERNRQAREQAEAILKRKLAAQKRENERIERERIEREQIERESIKKESIENEKIYRQETLQDDKKISFEFLKIDFFIEMILGCFVTIFVVGEYFFLPYVGWNKFGIFSNYTAIALSWLFIFELAKQCSIWTGKYLKGKIEKIITFLIIFELGLSALKVLSMALSGMRAGIKSIIIIMMLIIFGSSYIFKIHDNVSSKIKGQALVAKCIAGEYFFITLSGILFSIISLIKG